MHTPIPKSCPSGYGLALRRDESTSRCRLGAATPVAVYCGGPTPCRRRLNIHRQCPKIGMQKSAYPTGLALRRDECASGCRAWGCHSRRSLLRWSDGVPASAKHSQTMSKNWYAETCIPYGLALCNSIAERMLSAIVIAREPFDWAQGRLPDRSNLYRL